MSSSGKHRHRDHDVRRRDVDDGGDERAGDRIYRITDVERQKIAKALRFIDEARQALQDQQHAANREIIRELRASADAIFDVINELEELSP